MAKPTQAIELEAARQDTGITYETHEKKESADHLDGSHFLSLCDGACYSNLVHSVGFRASTFVSPCFCHHPCTLFFAKNCARLYQGAVIKSRFAEIVRRMVQFTGDGTAVAETTTIRARFANGVLEPLEDVRLHEGDEVVLRIELLSSGSANNWLEETAGGWKDLVDADELKQSIEQGRSQVTRPEPHF